MAVKLSRNGALSSFFIFYYFSYVFRPKNTKNGARNARSVLVPKKIKSYQNCYVTYQNRPDFYTEKEYASGFYATNIYQVIHQNVKKNVKKKLKKLLK